MHRFWRRTETMRSTECSCIHGCEEPKRMHTRSPTRPSTTIPCFPFSSGVRCSPHNSTYVPIIGHESLTTHVAHDMSWHGMLKAPNYESTQQGRDVGRLESNCCVCVWKKYVYDEPGLWTWTLYVSDKYTVNCKLLSPPFKGGGGTLPFENVQCTFSIYICIYHFGTSCQIDTRPVSRNHVVQCGFSACLQREVR